jgi:hypothetical protein
MDPSLWQMIKADNANAAREYYDTRDLVIVYDPSSGKKLVQALSATLTSEVWAVQAKFAQSVTAAFITTSVIRERVMPMDIVAPPLGAYWYVVFTYSDEGRAQREAVAAAFRKTLQAMAAEGSGVTEVSRDTPEYKVLALIFGHPVE